MQSKMVRCELRDMAGRPFAMTRFVDPLMSRWPWIQDVVASRFDCQADDVDTDEGEDGSDDFITVRGRRIGTIVHGNPVLVERVIITDDCFHGSLK